MPKYRDMQTAPKDGSRVLLHVPPYGAGSGHYDQGWHAHFCLNKEAEPVGWLPIPDHTDV